jgi:AcrR family transcriptional regulator
MPKDTRAALIKAARERFARDGYEGASVRAIARRARVNLGAITYHFGSKRALYEAVMGEAVVPVRERIGAAAAANRPALERIELMVRTLFDYLGDHPDMPRLMMQAMTSSQAIPKDALETVRANISALAVVIAEGQRKGTIRPGDPRLMALGIGAQPLWVAFARRALKEGVGVDPLEPETRNRLVESTARLVRAGLERRSEKDR